MFIKRFSVVLALIYSGNSLAMPNISVTKRVDINGFSEIQVQNLTRLDLACYVAIDGHKIRFLLPTRNTSQWFKATSTQYNHTHFKTWCADLKYHPRYEVYRAK